MNQQKSIQDLTNIFSRSGILNMEDEGPDEENLDKHANFNNLYEVNQKEGVITIIKTIVF